MSHSFAPDARSLRATGPSSLSTFLHAIGVGICSREHNNARGVSQRHCQGPADFRSRPVGVANGHGGVWWENGRFGRCLVLVSPIVTADLSNTDHTARRGNGPRPHHNS